jgi:hypothetical protein
MLNNYSNLRQYYKFLVYTIKKFYPKKKIIGNKINKKNNKKIYITLPKLLYIMAESLNP